MTKYNNIILGLGDPSDPLYALYLPVFDLFLVTYWDRSVLEKLRILLSSKCATCLIEVSSAQEYYHTIIDNTVCHNWTIENRDRVTFMDFPIKSIMLQGSDLGLRQKPQPCPVDLSSLIEFAQESLSLLVRACEIQSMPLTELIHKLNWFYMYTDIASFDSLDFFDGIQAQEMKKNIQDRLENFEEMRRHAINLCFKKIYWADNPSVLLKSLRDLHDPMIDSML